MEYWQKELKENLLTGGCVIDKTWMYDSRYFSRVVLYDGGMPVTIRKIRVKDIIAQHILPSYKGVEYYGDIDFSNFKNCPTYTCEDRVTLANFIAAVNAVKNMKEDDDPTTPYPEPEGSDTDYSSLLIIILIIVALWIYLK